ncbi:enoyl-CoA hydratase/isomerase family protein [Stappia sp. GBMRC 2046]|uniref:3-hydroxyisobutyryl-CoA hydrolase n=1 Tax=Stappia sediminis TaxID=2692190 RepID=A0A7X3LYG5_9HYPH|nr:enoyl-CoA hydratase/isomerase family protein [Stappia sediminis]MXN67341.1 enoyl-CoA hydratase/isomerase family protein [Stappia sediminis]
MTDEILFERRGKAGVITLNRPKALNALSHAMVKAMTAQLRDWEDDAAVRHIVVRAAGDKAFCAGGDIVNLYHMGKAGKAGGPEQVAFFADEYRLNHYIKMYRKPYVSLIDGIVMGGGVGLSVHGSHRVGTERVTFAMPEVGIGFFPDVGGSFFLPRMPQETGMYAALTAGRLKQADCLWSSILTHAVASDRLDELAEALCEADSVDLAIEPFSVNPGSAPIAEKAGEIETAFSAGSVGEILDRLDRAGEAAQGEWAAKTAAVIRSKSPTSVAVAFRELREGATLDFAGCMKLEFRIVSEIMRGHDFYEGVRAVLVDKDNSPLWKPNRLDAVDLSAVDKHFDEPDNGDLELSV